MKNTRCSPLITRHLALVTLICFLTTTLFDSGRLVFAFPVGSSATASGNVAGQLGQIAESAGPVQAFQADLFTGRAQTSVPIFVPPGRKNVQPNLALSYSSSGGNGWLGMGWNLDMGYIARDIKKGVPKYSAIGAAPAAGDDTLIFSFQGVSSELVWVATNEYRAKDEALFLKFVYDSTNNKWTVTDKSGTKHYFGETSASRQLSGSNTFKWLLSKVEDTSTNYMSVSYTTDNGELYLSTIDYNGNSSQSFAHTHKVEFTLEDRTDDSFSYLTGARVDTMKRLNNIQVKVKNGSGVYQLARKYVLGYEYSAATKRSRLITVTEYGKDGTTSLPATTFVYHDKGLGFDTAVSYTNIVNDSNVGSNGSYLRYPVINGSGWSDGKGEFIDIDGDGRHDRVQKTSSDSQWVYYRNLGASFADAVTISNIASPNSSASERYIRATSDSGEGRVELIDMNSDGLQDRLISNDSGTWHWQKNTGTAFDNTVSITGLLYDSNARQQHISYSSTGSTSSTTADLADMNGDGLLDHVVKGSSTDRFKIQWLSLNSSGQPVYTSSFSDFTGVDIPVGANSNWRDIRYFSTNGSNYSLTETELIDMNGDGLPDRVMVNPNDSSKWKIQYSNGSSFSSMQDWGPIENISGTGYERIRSRSDSLETHVDLLDLNADGLPDRLVYKDSDEWYVQYNTGTGFASTETITGIENPLSITRGEYLRFYNTSGGSVLVDLADIDGDGLSDRVQTDSGVTQWKVQKGKGPYPDLLKEIKNGRGGKTAITYSSSTQFDNTDTNGKHRLPFPIQVVTQVDQQDGMGNTYSTTYSYKGGMYDPTAREFRGFREVTVTDAVGTKTISTFGQTDALKGKLLTKEVRDSSDNLFAKDETTWSTANPYTGVNFTAVSQVDSYVYDGDGTYKQARKEFTYDSYGNIASAIERGDTGVSGDERKTVNEYNTNSTPYIMNTLKKTTLYDADLTTVKAERYFYYDGASSITTAPTAGLLTKEERWLSTASGCGTPGTCTNNPKTSMTFDSYGNVATTTDARSYTTTNTYDSTYHLFLITVSNALSQSRSLTYDPWLAQILTSTDQNSQVTETQYDVLGRITKIIGPLDTSSEPTQEFAYDYPNLGSCGSSCTTRLTTKVKSSVPGQTFTQLITYSFTDGLGREIQRRSPAEDSGQQIVSGLVTFNSRGLVDKQYVPYFATTSTSYVAIDTSKPKATFTYDAVGRRTRIDYPDSTNSQVAFSDFVKTTTDQRGKQLRHTNDAYGRLVKVEEFNSGSTYTTTYEYDVLNNLKKTTDNASNETTITYDSLSRKTSMTDPDMGTWSYVYDLNNNLTSQTDANSQTISFTYDAINRVTLKDLPSGETDVAYSYGTAPTTYSGQTGYWTGRLAKITDASGTQEFKYDKSGRLIDDTKTVDSIGYVFTRTYDSMGRLRTITYPDTEVVTYGYNGFGDIETIQGVKSGVTTDYIKEVNYNASGQISFTKYGNNVTSDYTYNSNTLRLSNILTKKPDGTTKLQDLAYTFDNNGNVATIADTVNSMSQSFTYDDLNRLTQAVGSAYGTQNFVYDSIGNMTTKGSRTMAYGEGAPGPHAATTVSWSSSNFPTFCRDYASGACTLGYDTNGNMTTRGADTLSYDSENRLKEMKVREGSSGTTNYTLKPGWNVISFTHLPDNRSVSSVLSSLTFNTDYDQVSTWDSASGTWKHWVNDSDFNDFTEFQFGKTYEIYNKTGVDKSLSVTGKTTGVDISHGIVSGDNFISPAVKTATNVTTVLSGLTQGTHYSDVKRFNATSQAWESYAGGAFTQFEPGKGYNIIGLTTASFSYGKTETTTTFVYDSTGARVKKNAGGTTTVYVGKDYDVSGGTSTKYIFLSDRRIANKTSGGTVLYYHEDHISSSNVITDSSGNQAALYEYDPYGSTVTYTGSASVKHQFTGQEKDDSTGLLYYGLRYMDPQLGRFITSDQASQNPFDPQSLNSYAYARNNPIKYNDPTGLGWFSKLIGAIIGAIAFVASGFNVAVGIAVFSAVDATISARQNGASWGRALAIGAVGLAAGIVGGAAGSTIGAAFGQGAGTFGGAVFSGAFAGAFAGSATAAVAGGDPVRGGLAGAAGGAAGGSVGSIFGGLAGSFVGGGIGNMANGGSFINGAVDGVYNSIGMTVVSLAGIHGTPFEELMGKGKINGGDRVFLAPEIHPISLLVAFIDPGPTSHVITSVGGGKFVDSAVNKGGVGFRDASDFFGRRAWVLPASSQDQAAIMAAANAMGKKGNVSYNIPPFGQVCSTCANQIRSDAGTRGSLGIGPNTQFFNEKSKLKQ